MDAYYFITGKCFGCCRCNKKCPAKCIGGGRRELHVIDADKCLKCGGCAAICPRTAIERRER